MPDDLTILPTPHSHEAEKALLGSILHDPEVIDSLIGRLNERHFFAGSHQTIWQHLVDMREGDIPIDLVSVTQRLEDRRQLEEVGGAFAVTELFTFIPTAANSDYYADMLEEKFTQRETQKLGRVMATEWCQLDHKALMDKITLALGKIMGLAETRRQTRSIADLIRSRTPAWEEAVRTSGQSMMGWRSCIEPWDNATYGFRPGSFHVIGAETKGGKTKLALNCAVSVARQLAGVGVVSLEMSDLELTDALACIESDVDLDLLKKGQMDSDVQMRFSNGLMRLGKLPIWIRDEGHMTPPQFRAICRRMKAEHDIEVVILDYLQLVSPAERSRPGGSNREREVAETSRTCKLIAKDFGISILALTQLNDDGEVRESRAIKQDCDSLTIIEDRMLKIRYNRNGPTPHIPITFRAETGQFVYRQPEEKQ